MIGLDRLVQALTRLDAARIAGCLVEATGQFALAFFTEDASGVIGVLHVAPASDDAPTHAAL